MSNFIPEPSTQPRLKRSIWAQANQGEVLESFGRSLSVPGTYLKRSPGQLLKAFTSERHWLGKSLIPTSEEVENLLYHLKCVPGGEAIPVANVVKELLPYAVDRAKEAPSDLKKRYLEAVASADFAIGPRFDKRKPGQLPRDFHLDASQACGEHNVLKVHYGSPGLYSLVLELRNHPKLGSYRRTRKNTAQPKLLRPK